MVFNKFCIVLIFCFICYFSFSQSGAYIVSTVAGDTAGYRNGNADSALFNAPSGIAVDSSGNIYVVDTYNNTIRMISTNGMVSTLAGDTSGYYKGIDSTGGYLNGLALKARFLNPLGICVDKNGNVYIADTYNSVIRKISGGMVTTYAGRDSAGIAISGWVDGPDSLAEFNIPVGIAIDSIGNLYVTDNGNNAIREITASGMVTTLAGGGPTLAGYMNGTTIKDTAVFNGIFGIALNKSGAIFVSEYNNNAIREIKHDTVTTYAGYDTVGLDTAISFVPLGGYVNGFVDTARFNNPTGIAFDASYNLFVSDEYNNVIREVAKNDSTVNTFAGCDTIGTRDGNGDTAEFFNPLGIAYYKGTFYVSDNGNNRIRKIAIPPAGIPLLHSSSATIKVYPNPCSNIFTIGVAPQGNAELSDITGRVVWSEINFTAPYSLAVDNFAPGVYVLTIKSNQSKEPLAVKKIVIER
jgi:hypothetical protein